MGPIRIAILECDIPIKSIVDEFGTYGDLFEKNLTEGAEALDSETKPQLQFSRFNIVDEPGKFPALEDVDAVLLTGSRHDAHAENVPWIDSLLSYTQTILSQSRVRIIGICFGHQILARALGYKVGRSSIGWEVGTTEIDLTEEGKNVLGLQELRMQQMHRDIVYPTPSVTGPVNIGASSRCAIHGLYCKDRYISVQGHPEYNTKIVCNIVDARTPGVFSDKEAEQFIENANKEHDGKTISRILVRFLL